MQLKYFCDGLVRYLFFSLPLTLDIHFLCIDPALVFHSSATTPYEGGNSIHTSFENTSKTKGIISAKIYTIPISKKILIISCFKGSTNTIATFIRSGCRTMENQEWINAEKVDIKGER